MTWWQTLLVTVAPVLLTLVVTSVAEARRRHEDARERAKDRAAQDTLREQDRLAAAQVGWRADKMQAHRELLLFGRRLWRCMVEAGGAVDSLRKIHTSEGQALTPEIRERLDEINAAFRPLDGVSEEMDALLADVQMFCSEEARDAALRFEHQQMRVMLNVHAVLNGNGHKEVDGVSFYERWPKDIVPITAFVLAEYPAIVRRDLQPG